MAEKVEAMVKLGMANSRMKDFFDLHYLSRLFTFESQILGEAIKATFKRRGTEIPTKTPMALTDQFAMDNAKQVQWNAFIKRSGLLGTMGTLKKVILDLSDFVLPPLFAAGGSKPLEAVWNQAGQWQAKASGD